MTHFKDTLPITGLKNCSRLTDNTYEHLCWSSKFGGTYMGDKHNDHSKKKLTKKELKAQNHAKLMASKGSPSNVVDINAYRKDENKKAA
jgi:hypothetical protein